MSGFMALISDTITSRGDIVATIPEAVNGSTNKSKTITLLNLGDISQKFMLSITGELDDLTV